MHSDARVIIIAPLGQDATAMAELLGGEGFETRICQDLGEGAEQVQAGAGVLLMTEEALELPEFFRLETVLQAQPSWSELPIIILTTGGEPRLRRLLDVVAAAAGMVTLLERPLSVQTLVRSVRVAMRSRQRQYQVRGLIRELATAREELRQHAVSLEETVAERTRALNDTVLELESFSYSVAHDMRSPLRAMSGFARILIQEYDHRLDPSGKDLLHRIAGSAERLDQLIQDVLHYSRVARNDMPLGPINSEKLLKGILESYPNLQRPEIKIQVTTPLPVVYANEAALTQVFSNLLDNAVKFVSPGVAPRVNVWGEHNSIQPSTARFWIEDNGIGISPESKNRLFQLFQRLNPPGLYSGTGIGLAIVQKSVRRMGGNVGVESEIGKGSRFWVELRTA